MRFCLLPVSLQPSNIRCYSRGVRFHGFTYYPRFPEEKDPPYEPSKLLMVKRVKPVKGNPYWHKSILRSLGLIGQPGDVAIVKNIPENNARLWQIKHLVKITPITFPHGFPTDEDVHNTYLDEAGRLLVYPRLDPARLEASEALQRDKTRMDGDTLRKQLRLQWLNPW